MAIDFSNYLILSSSETWKDFEDDSESCSGSRNIKDYERNFLGTATMCERKLHQKSVIRVHRNDVFTKASGVPFDSSSSRIFSLLPGTHNSKTTNLDLDFCNEFGANLDQNDIRMNGNFIEPTGSFWSPETNAKTVQNGHLFVDTGKEWQSSENIRPISQEKLLRLSKSQDESWTSLSSSDEGLIKDIDFDHEGNITGIVAKRKDVNTEQQTLRQISYRSRRSLPDRLTNDHETPAKLETKKRYGRRGSVKFADEFGMNLNTFAMIPSRDSTVAGEEIFGLWMESEDWTSLHEMVLTERSLKRKESTKGFRWDILRDFGLCRSNEDEVVFQDEYLYPERLKQSYKTCSFSQEKITSNSVISDSTRTKVSDSNCSCQYVRQDRFRLCFEQPFADIEKFLNKLKENFICLENVRVDNRSSWQIGDRESSFQQNGVNRSSGATIICSIKVRHVEEQVRVYARCTYNDWSTFADLPAQHFSGVTNLGYEYDTFCFAVRKPVQAPLSGTQGWNGVSEKPTSAVEFAVCYHCLSNQASYWDNNEQKNYRIEWFD